MKAMVFLMIFLGWTVTAHAQGKIQDGLCKIYKRNTITHLASLKKVELNGVAFQYFRNGVIQRQSWYEHNELTGLTKLFSPEKKLVQIKVYDHDRLLDVQK